MTCTDKSCIINIALYHKNNNCKIWFHGDFKWKMLKFSSILLYCVPPRKRSPKDCQPPDIKHRSINWHMPTWVWAVVIHLKHSLMKLMRLNNWTRSLGFHWLSCGLSIIPTAPARAVAIKWALRDDFVWTQKTLLDIRSSSWPGKCVICYFTSLRGFTYNIMLKSIIWCHNVPRICLKLCRIN